MRIIKIPIIVGLACVFSFTFSSCKNTETESTSIQNTQIISDTTNQEATLTSASVSEIRLEDLVVENLQINKARTHVTGLITDFLEIDAELIATVDPLSPGIASSYTATRRPFSTQQRTMFVQPGWTLVESEILAAQYPSQEEGYQDVYEDDSGNRYVSFGYNDIAVFYTPQGSLIDCVEIPMEYRSQVDFEFASEQEAYETAKTFAETVGYRISHYYYVDRLPYEELEISSRTIDRSTIEEVLPQGWSSDQDSYVLTLFADIDGLPMVNSGGHKLSAEYAAPFHCVIEVLVTPKGVEYGEFYFQYENTNVQSTGEMCDIEEALNLFVKETLTGNTLLIPPLKISHISLVYLGQWEPSTDAVLLRPYWVFEAEETGPDSSGGIEHYYIDALNKTVVHKKSFTGPEV